MQEEKLLKTKNLYNLLKEKQALPTSIRSLAAKSKGRGVRIYIDKNPSFTMGLPSFIKKEDNPSI